MAPRIRNSSGERIRIDGVRVRTDNCADCCDPPGEPSLCCVGHVPGSLVATFTSTFTDTSTSEVLPTLTGSHVLTFFVMLDSGGFCTAVYRKVITVAHCVFITDQYTHEVRLSWNKVGSPGHSYIGGTRTYRTDTSATQSIVFGFPTVGFPDGCRFTDSVSNSGPTDAAADCNGNPNVTASAGTCSIVF